MVGQSIEKLSGQEHANNAFYWRAEFIRLSKWYSMDEIVCHVQIKFEFHSLLQANLVRLIQIIRVDHVCVQWWEEALAWNAC